MKTKINTKATRAAKAAVFSAQMNLDYYKRISDGSDFDLDRVEYAKEKLTEAQKAFSAAAEPLADAIHNAEGRAKARTIDAADVVKALDAVENRLFNIKKKALEGVKISVDVNAQSFPSAYRYVPESTQFCAEFKRGEWVITDISRLPAHGEGHAFRVYLTDEARAAIISKCSEF